MIYNSIYPKGASGVALDNLCKFVGIERNSATAAQHLVKVYGKNGYIVPIGFLLKTENEVYFYNISNQTIVNGECEIYVACTVTGTTGNVNSDTINIVANPVSEVTSVEGIMLVETGSGAESDYSLRKRFDLAVAGAGSCTETAIRAALMRITSVDSVGVVKNDTTETDSDGRPPFSFECYISGGESYHQEIAETIFDKKPIGIKTYGDVTVEIKDSGGTAHNVSFSHTKYVTSYVKIKIRTNSKYQGDESVSQISSNLAEVINGLSIGDDVIMSRLYGSIHSVVGVDEVTELTLSTDGKTYNAKNIEIKAYEKAKFAAVKIEVI
jgi:uncharacterized phage protein gp47/JayE